MSYYQQASSSGSRYSMHTAQTSGPYPTVHALNTGSHPPYHTRPQPQSYTPSGFQQMATQSHPNPTQNERFQYPPGTVHPATSLFRLNQIVQKVQPPPKRKWEDQECQKDGVVFHRSRYVLADIACEWSDWIKGAKKDSREAAAAHAIQQVQERYHVRPHQ